jgi:hypothetical protein
MASTTGYLPGLFPDEQTNRAYPAGYPGGANGSNATAPSAPGAGWEIYVRAGTDFTTLLAVIPQSMLVSFQFVRQLDDIGSGTVVLSQDDPWWSDVTLPGGLASDTLLNDECLWQVYQNGVNRFEFLGETITEQLVDPSEQRVVTITGPGTIATLKWAMIAPQGFPNIVNKLDAIEDSFDEINAAGNGVLDTNIWNSVSPSSHIYITPTQGLYDYPGGAGYALSTLYPSGSLTLVASPSTTFLGATPYDASDTLISAQVTPVGVSATAYDSANPAKYGTGLNGSELTQFYVQSNLDTSYYALFGLSSQAFYVQAAGPGGVATKILSAYDPTNHAYWMITEQGGSGGGSGTFYFWTSPDGENWTQQWTYVHSWNATNTAFYVTSYYSVDNSQQAQLTNLNSNVTTPSYQGSIYLGGPLMAAWVDQYQAAQARGTIEFVTTDVTAVYDTYGRTWTDTENVQLVNGTDLYTFLQSATSVVNADYVMNPGFRLVVGQPEEGAISLGTDRSGYVILREGYDCASKQRTRARNQINTSIGGENADGHEISASSPAYISEWGQREGWYQTAAQVDPTSMAYATAAALAQNETEVLSWTLTLTPNLPGRTVFQNFDVGDWIGLELPDFSAVDAVRVMGIAVSVDDTGTETHELTLISYIQWLSEQLTYISNLMGGQFLNATGTSPVAPSKYGTGQVPTYFTPAASLATLADVSGASSASTNSPLVYNSATGNYQPAGTSDPVSGNTVPLTVSGASGVATVAGGSVAVTEVTPGPAADGQSAGASQASVVTTPTAATVTSASGVVRSTLGLQVDGTITQVDVNAPAPNAPDTPSLVSIVQGIAVTWDGKLASAAPLLDFSKVQVYVSTVSGFTPSSATLVGSMVTAGTLAVSGLTPGTTYYAKLIAVNTSGTQSAASAQGSVAAGYAQASLLGNIGVLNANPYFWGGDGTGWHGYQGTFAVTSSPPAGAPYEYAGVYVNNGTSSGAMEENSSGTASSFAAVPATQYLVTAWVNSSATTVQLGFDWDTSSGTYISTTTQNFTVTANTWTQITTVQTAPATTGYGYPRIGTATASGATIYAQAVLVLPQVPGSLIEAGTITVTQLAAGIIYAGIINGTLVEGAEIVCYSPSGSPDGVYVYTAGTTPALGNVPLLALGGESVDPYGNSTRPSDAYPGGQLIALGPSGSYVQLAANNTELALNIGTGAAGEQYPGQVKSLTSGSGSAETLITQVTAPMSGGSAAELQLSSASDDGVTSAPYAVLGVAGTSFGVYSGETTTGGPLFQWSDNAGVWGVDRSQTDYASHANSNQSGYIAITQAWTIPAYDARDGTTYLVEVPYIGTFETSAVSFGVMLNGSSASCDNGVTSTFFSSGSGFDGVVVAALTVTATGSSGKATLAISGVIGATALRSSTNQASLSDVVTNVSFSTVISNTIAIGVNFGGLVTGQVVTGYGSTFTRKGP